MVCEATHIDEPHGIVEQMFCNNMKFDESILPFSFYKYSQCKYTHNNHIVRFVFLKFKWNKFIDCSHYDGYGCKKESEGNF